MFLVRNNGNDCYLISIIQSLLNSYPMIYFFTLGINLKNHKDLYETFAYLLNNNVIINSTTIKKLVVNFDSESEILFNNKDQQDAHEAIVKMIDIIHKISIYPEQMQDDKLRNISKNISDEEKNAHEQVKKNARIFGYSFVSEYFSGQFKSTVSCNCGYKNISYDLFNNVNLSITGEDISDCFQGFIKIEKIKDAKCEMCGLKKLIKNNSIWKFPKILIVNLKRYEYDENGRLIKNNKELNNSENIYFQSNNVLHTYKLISVVNHHGMSPGRGHYTSDIFKNNKWIHIDDDFYNEISVEKLDKRNSYIFIYSYETNE